MVTFLLSSMEERERALVSSSSYKDTNPICEYLTAQMVKNLPANAGHTRDPGSIPGSGRSPGEGNGNPLQYSCLQNTMDRGAWQAIVHGIAKSQT